MRHRRVGWELQRGRTLALARHPEQREGSPLEASARDGRRPLSLFTCTKHVTVDGHIEDQNESPQDELIVSGQRGRIEDRKNVVLDEATRITCAARLLAKRVFQRRKGADTAGQLDGGPPECRRDVNVGHPWPPEDEQSTEYHEQHEEKVNGYDEIGHYRGGKSVSGENKRKRGGSLPGYANNRVILGVRVTLLEFALTPFVPRSRFFFPAHAVCRCSFWFSSATRVATSGGASA